MRSLKQGMKSFNITCSCKDPIKCLEHMFVDMVQKKRVAAGQCPVRRPVFLRTHGIMKGEIEIHEKVSDDLKQGMFAHAGKHPVYVRYSSDLSDGRPDWKSTIGLGIKLFGIKGEKEVSDDGAEVADLILQNVPFFFVDNASDFCNFTKAGFEGWSDQWVQENSPKTNILLDKMAKPIRSVFETSVWSVVPFKLGKDNYCKYIVRPGKSTFSGEVDINDPDFLGKDLAARMKAGNATLNLYIQRRPTTKEFEQAYIDKHFPLDKAMTVWDEDVAKPELIATISLPKQDIMQPEQEIYGDWLDFNIGRVPKLNAPAPQSSIALARMKVYAAAAKYRHDQNGQPNEQPKQPGKPIIKNPTCPLPNQPKSGPAPKKLTKEQIDRITSVRIHPGIGVARVGDSKSDYYVGPEVTEPKLVHFGSTRDDSGAIKRQAARFRVYGYDANGDVVAEIQQSENSTIEWSVHVANRKAQWYEFQSALDLPQTASVTVALRNPEVTGAARGALAIDPGPCKIQGLNMNDSSYSMVGNFQGTQVYLGELRTDSVGRLLVLPGFGKSASPANKPVYRPEVPTSFNNAAGWYDDIADGPVHAKVVLEDKVFSADPAWVASAPPNYGQNLVGWRTMDDLMRAVWTDCGMLQLPKRVEFQRDVLPVLARLNELQWVNKGFFASFGAGSPFDFSDVELLKKLSIAPLSSLYPDPYAELRRTVYHNFRGTDSVVISDGTNGKAVNSQISQWPMMYGDLYGETVGAGENAASTYLTLPPYFDYVLTCWVNGNFVSDFNPEAKNCDDIEQVPLQEQPDMLDRANMHFCLADAFHPGCELTWPMRHASMYRAPYRIRERAEGKAQPSYGSMLDQNKVLAVGGPLYEQGPGDLTRWMALPWQGDTAFCRSGYDSDYDPFMPTYWPARVPNNVLTLSDYNILADKKQPMELRIAAFRNRPSWFRQLPSGAVDAMDYMVAHFNEMGILEAKDRPDDLDWLPEKLWVENLTATKQAELDEAYKIFQKNYAKLGPSDKALQEAGWFNEEQRDEFATIVKS